MTENKVKISFDDTGKGVSPMRKAMVLFLKKTMRDCGKAKVKKFYKIRYCYGDLYFSINLNSLVIETTSRLEAIILMNDYMNRYAKCSEPHDFYEDQSFIDIVCEYVEINCYDVDDIFESKYIGEIMDKYIETQFSNDTLWLEECHYLKSEF